MGDNIDFETVLPYVINRFLPAGLVGVLLAGLLSSFMANFSATVNAGAAYLVNDIYKKHFDPEADNRKLVKVSYLGSVLILIAGIVIGMFLSIDHTDHPMDRRRALRRIHSGKHFEMVLVAIQWLWIFLGNVGWNRCSAYGSRDACRQSRQAFHDPTYAYPFILLLSFIGCIVGH